MTKYSSDEIKQIKKSPWNFFVKHSRVTFLLIIIIIVWGLHSMWYLPKEINPEVDLPYGAVITAYPGANPRDVEELVTDKIESAAKNVEDVKELTSSSNFGVSTVLLYFNEDVDLDDSLDKLEASVNRVKSELPEEAEEPFVSKFDANKYPIIVYSLISDIEEGELKTISEDAKDEIEKLTGVSEVAMIGARDKQINIELDQSILQKYSINLSQIVNSIKSSNINFPVGTIETDGFKYSIRIEAAVDSSLQLANIPVKEFQNQNGVPQTILLKDLGKISEDYEEKNTIARVGLNKKESIKKSVSLQVFKKSDANIVQVAKETKDLMKNLEGSMIPDTVDVMITNDNYEFYVNDMETLGTNGLQTIILIMIIVFVFLGLKEGIIAGLSIPFSMLITFGIIYFLGESLNSLTLFSLVFALGLLIDNAIIIIEGIHDNLKSQKYTSYGSAILAIYEFKWPIIAGTLTTIFAFLPILTVSGITGDYMKVIPITVTAVLLASLFVNISITPTIASKLIKPGKKKNYFKKIQKRYKTFIRNTLKSRFKKAFYLFLLSVVCIISFSLPITGILKSEAFPISDFRYFFIDIKTPEGTTLENTEKIVSNIESDLIKIPEIESFATNIGTSSGGAIRQMFDVSQDKTNIANITVNLVEEEERERKSYEVSEGLRNQLKKIKKAEVSVTDLQGGPPSGAPIEVSIKGDDFEKLENLAYQIEGLVNTIDGTYDTETSIEKGAGEFNIKLEREKLNYYAISPVQVASLLRNALEGVQASEIKRNGEEVDVLVTYSLNENSNEITIDDLRNIQITSPVSGSVPLSYITNFEFKENLTTIDHLDTKRVAYVTSYLKDKTATEATAELMEKLKPVPVPKGYQIEYGGEFEEVQQSFKDLGIALIVGLLLIFVLLVLQFKSYSQPFIILLSLPFALTGVFFGLTAMGITLSIPSVIGVVGLSGVVVNDAIVLVDQMNKNRKRGMALEDAIAEGTTSRLQPVFLTTITSICGILPLALTNEIWGSLAFAFIFGLSTQFFLVLLLDPILYSLFSRKKEYGAEPGVYIPAESKNITSTAE
jgi:multidrug efflux pump subunit AcrB